MMIRSLAIKSLRIEVSPAKVQILYCESGHILSKQNILAIAGIEYSFSKVIPDDAMQLFCINLRNKSAEPQK